MRHFLELMRSYVAGTLRGRLVCNGAAAVHQPLQAVCSIRRANQTVDVRTIADSPQRSFWQAITAIWITPQVYINWSEIGVPALLAYSEQSPWHETAFLAGFYALWVTGLAAQIIIFGQAGKLNQTATHYLAIAATLLLVGFGVCQR